MLVHFDGLDVGGSLYKKVFTALRLFFPLCVFRAGGFFLLRGFFYAFFSGPFFVGFLLIFLRHYAEFAEGHHQIIGSQTGADGEKGCGQIGLPLRGFLFGKAGGNGPDIIVDNAENCPENKKKTENALLGNAVFTAEFIG